MHKYMYIYVCVAVTLLIVTDGRKDFIGSWIRDVKQKK